MPSHRFFQVSGVQWGWNAPAACFLLVSTLRKSWISQTPISVLEKEKQVVLISCRLVFAWKLHVSRWFRSLRELRNEGASRKDFEASWFWNVLVNIASLRAGETSCLEDLPCSHWSCCSCRSQDGRKSPQDQQKTAVVVIAHNILYIHNTIHDIVLFMLYHIWMFMSVLSLGWACSLLVHLDAMRIFWSGASLSQFCQYVLWQR